MSEQEKVQNEQQTAAELAAAELEKAQQTTEQAGEPVQLSGEQAIIAKLKTDLTTPTNDKPFIGFDSFQDLKGIDNTNYEHTLQILNKYDLKLKKMLKRQVSYPKIRVLLT